MKFPTLRFCMRCILILGLSIAIGIVFTSIKYIQVNNLPGIYEAMALHALLAVTFVFVMEVLSE